MKWEKNKIIWFVLMTCVIYITMASLRHWGVITTADVSWGVEYAWMALGGLSLLASFGLLKKGLIEGYI